MKFSHLPFLLSACISICTALRCQTITSPNNADAWIQQGQASLDRGIYTQAESDFRKAISLDQNSTRAYVFLTRALLGELPRNLKLFPDVQNVLPKAEQAINRAVQLSPENAEALCVQGIVSYKLALTSKNPDQRNQRVEQARALWNRALALNPKLAEAHVELARMIATEDMDAILSARLASGMKVGQGGPIADVTLRRSLRAQYEPSIEEGLQHARAALELDLHNAQAMNQMSALILLRANFRESDAEFTADLKEAANWQQQALAWRSKPPQTPPNLAAGVIGGIIGSVPAVAAPKK